MNVRKKPLNRGQRHNALRIVCLGWGSLVWRPRDLPVRGIWFADGPFLPIEFARQSSDGRITLVLMTDIFPFVRSMWTLMSVASVKEARKALGTRECSQSSKPENCVDYSPGATQNATPPTHLGNR